MKKEDESNLEIFSKLYLISKKKKQNKNPNQQGPSYLAQESKDDRPKKEIIKKRQIILFHRTFRSIFHNRFINDADKVDVATAAAIANCGYQNEPNQNESKFYWVLLGFTRF